MRLNVQFFENDKEIQADFGEITHVTEYIGGEPYDGSYVVTPKVSEQVLSTAEKVMSDDMTIKAIPFFKTSNQMGGDTVYIGNEV